MCGIYIFLVILFNTNHDKRILETIETADYGAGADGGRDGRGFSAHHRQIRKRGQKGVRPHILIVTSGLDGIYPKDLIIGSVSHVVSEAGDIFKQAYVKPAYAPFSHTQVFVITDHLR